MTTSLQLSYGGVLLGVFAQQVGVPVPSVVFLMAAGALSAHGVMSPAVIVFLGVLACLAGDGIWFWIGRRWGSKAVRLLCRLTPDPRSCSRDAQEKFRRYGLPVLCVAKFLPGLDAVMPPLGGAEGVSVTRFLAVDAVGSFLWSVCYVGLGYIFSNQLDIAIRWVQHCGTAFGAAIVVPIVVYIGWRGLTVARMIRRLKLRRISPPLLARKLKSRSKVAVLDLLNFEKEIDGDSLEAIPGAFSIDPSLLQKSSQITIPDDVEIILYCSSRRDILSARVAVALKRIGVDRVWVLEGGLEAWRRHGLPVARCLEVPELVAKRLGINLPQPPPKRREAGDPLVERQLPCES